ncbi:MAG: hypothetical protein U9R23_06765 [Candidatus Cloacimonadota bacterium]|nr:hypothetical protein [Candidatus Cloacimonadota bacterium]
MMKQNINPDKMWRKILLIAIIVAFAFILTFCSKKTTSPEEQLLAPANLEITLVENNKIQLSWTDNSTNETKFLISRKVGTFNWQDIFDEVEANITSFPDVIHTTSDTVYSYRVRAFDGNDYSDYSIPAGWFGEIAAPTNLQLEQIAQDSIKLIWQDNSIGELNFRVDRKIGDADWQENYKLLEPDTTSYIDYNPSLYDTCYYKVFAVCGNSYSDSTQNYFIPFLPAPSNLQIEPISATSIKLTWKDNCENEDGFCVYKKEEGNDWDSTNIPADTEEWTDQNVIPGIINYYKLCAYIGDDHSGYIEADINSLPAPTNLQIEQLNVHTFKLDWDDNSIFEQGYKIDRKIDDEEWVNELGYVDSNITTWTDSTVGRNYEVVYYRVYGYYEEYNSTKIESNSNIVFPAPSNLQYEILSVNSVKLTWNDNSIGEEGFKIDKKVLDGDWQIEYTILDENTTEWIDENVDFCNNIYYCYKIYAFYENNISSKSEMEVFNTFKKTFGGSSSDGGSSVSQTYDGGFIITGWTKSYGAGRNDIWLIKTDALGNEEWNKTFGGSNTDEGYSVSQTDDEGFIITGRTSSYGAGGYDVWLIKTDALGDEEWNKTFGGIDWDSGQSVSYTEDGGYIITGWTQSYGAGGYDVWLIKTDVNGNEEWNRTFGGSSDDRGESVSQTDDGGFIITGSTASYGYDVWLIKTDANGNEEWNKTFGGDCCDCGNSVSQTVDGGFIITGWTASYGHDVWLIKTNENGNEEWNRTFDGNSKDEGESVSQTNDGGFIIIGSTGLQEASGSDIWLIKTDAIGNEEWDKTFSGSYIDYGKSVSQTNDGGFIITGSTKSTYDYDVWLIKTDDEGNVE